MNGESGRYKIKPLPNPKHHLYFSQRQSFDVTLAGGLRGQNAYVTCVSAVLYTVWWYIVKYEYVIQYAYEMTGWTA